VCCSLARACVQAPAVTGSAAAPSSGGQLGEKVAQAALQALEAFLEDQQDHARKGQLAPTGEGLGMSAVPGQEGRALQSLAHGLDEPQGGF
jgi:type II secretory pathway pseudopilin PulG